MSKEDWRKLSQGAGVVAVVAMVVKVIVGLMAG
jgi:hypothetical protein